MKENPDVLFFRKIRNDRELNCAEIALGVFAGPGDKIYGVKEKDNEKLLHVFVKLENGKYVAPCGYTSPEAEVTGYFLKENEVGKKLVVEEISSSELIQQLSCRKEKREKVKRWARKYLG